MASAELWSRRREIESARAAGRAIDPVIDGSWQRCKPLLPASRAHAPVDAEPDEVGERWEASPIRRSGIGVEAQLASAAEASDLIAAITDEEGRILWTAGSTRMRDLAAAVGFVPGGRWDEASAGTNALGLALLTGRPASVFSAEHWCQSVQDWVCWSVPVRAPDGRRLGVLDLSGKWDRASPVAALAVASLARLVEEHLPSGVVAPGAEDGLTLRLLGQAGATFRGQALALSPRQSELLAALALEGPCSLDRLSELVYGDRQVRAATVKAEISHLRRLLGGGIASRPYRLTVPVRVDVTELRQMLRDGDLRGATLTYAGQMLPNSESPFAVDHRHVVDVMLREALLSAGSADELLRFAEVHRYDEAVLERAMAVAAAHPAARHEAEARLDLARRG